MRRMRLFEVCSLALFTALITLSIVLSIFLKAVQISLALIFISFATAIVVAIFGSLSIREEEEEKS